MTLTRLTLVPMILLMAAEWTRAQTCYPMVNRVEPTAIQRGSSSEITILGGGASGGGGDFSGAFAILCEDRQLTGEVVSASTAEPGTMKSRGSGRRRGGGNVKARLTVAPDAPLGPREIRIATPQGVSSVGLIVVVDDPVVTESDDKANDASKAAQILTLPCVASGSIGKTEDVDWYAFTAKAGQRVTFSVWANRLENKIHDLQTHFDPILFLHDSTGRELAADDNHDFADPLLSHEFKEDGTYYLQVRDTTYGGNAHWTYVLQATTGPVATSVFPLAVKPGAKAELHARGPNINPDETIAYEVPATCAPGPQLVALPTTKGPTLATHVVVTQLPVVKEADDADEAYAKSQTVTLPAAICGRLDKPNDVDTFRFEAKKGTIYAFEVVARRAGCATDPTLRLINEKDATVTEADDTNGLGKDARIEWTAPADGLYAVQLNDLHSRGGDEFGYVVLAEPARPDFTLTCDPDKLGVGPNSRVPLFVQLTRRAGFDGPVTIDLGPLPPGVSASPLTIGPKMTQGLIVVSAAADAKPAAALLSLTGKAETKSGPIVRSVSPKQEIYLPGGGRGVYPVDTLALAVTAPCDITLDVKPKTLSLKPGEKATIDVTVHRKEGFEQAVNLAIVLQHLGGIHANPLPPGVKVVEAGSKTLLSAKETQGKIIVQADANASPIENIPICVMGHISINFVVKTAYASEPIQVSVAGK